MTNPCLPDELATGRPLPYPTLADAFDAAEQHQMVRDTQLNRLELLSKQLRLYVEGAKRGDRLAENRTVTAVDAIAAAGAQLRGALVGLRDVEETRMRLGVSS